MIVTNSESYPGGSGRMGNSSEDFDDLFAYYVDRLTEGELLDPDAIRHQYPHLAGRLIADLEAFVGAGSSHGNDRPLGAQAFCYCRPDPLGSARYDRAATHKPLHNLAPYQFS